MSRLYVKTPSQSEAVVEQLYPIWNGGSLPALRVCVRSTWP